MENLDKELETLRADMNKRIDEIKAKIEKPAFDVGRYVKDQSNEVALIKETFKESIRVVWVTGSKNRDGVYFKSSFELLTPQEVQAALEKEAVKMYPIGTKIGGGFARNGIERQTVRCHEFHYNKIGNTLLVIGSENSGCGLTIFDNGTWATPIKTMSIDELAEMLWGKGRQDIISIVTENKTAIIETLNSL